MELDEVLDSHFSQTVLDIRSTRNGRWMDQKVTPDVLSFVADCVINLDPKLAEKGFSKNDVWFSPYFMANVTLYFGKPDAEDDGAKLEYDKFTAQPLKTLAYAGILSEFQSGRTNYYRIANLPLLRFVSLSQANAFNFLVRYIRAVLEASGFYHHVEHYFASKCTNEDLLFLKGKFHAFTVGNTAINGRTEMARIFPKVLNPLACFKGLPGTQKGRVSKFPINFSDLRYNDTNWRDVGKDKRITRQEQATLVPSETLREYETKKVMDAVRNRHSPQSELQDAWSHGDATQVHHIFPRSKYPSLVATKENLILLTPTQHYTKAHPKNSTGSVDRNYQIDCLVAKIRSVEKSDVFDLFYTPEGMRFVLLAGLGMETSVDEPWSNIVARLQSYRA